MTDTNTAEREALQAYLNDCDAHAIVPDVGGAWHAAFQAGRASLAASAGSKPLTDSYVQIVPDKCDRIVWRNRYYHLPLTTPQPTQAQAGAPRVSPEQWQALFDAQKRLVELANSRADIAESMLKAAQAQAGAVPVQLMRECFDILGSFDYEDDEDSQFKAFFKAHINVDWFFHVKHSIERLLEAETKK